MKTIEEAAKSANAFGYPNYTGVNNEAFDSGFKSGVEFAQRWIPVAKELPEYNLTILFKEMNNNARIHLGHRSQLVDNFVEMAITYQNITHWRPIERS